MTAQRVPPPVPRLARGADAIRPMEDHDTEAVIDLLWALNRHEAPIAGDRPLDRDAAARCLDAALRWTGECGGANLVAEVEGGVAAYLCWGVAQSGPYVRKELRTYGYVQELVVGQAHRGAGLGQRLLGEAERLTRARGLKRLMLGVLVGNEEALRAYARFGLKPYAMDLSKILE